VDGVDLRLVETTLGANGEPGYRAQQIWEWMSCGASGFEEMANIPGRLRRELAATVPFSNLTPPEEARSRDGTVKTLFRTADGHPVDAVLRRYRDARRSLCLSSQSGCPLTCRFCTTGAMRFGRNLTAWEVLDQPLHGRRREAVHHAVFMGMGEPVLSPDEVRGALNGCRTSASPIDARRCPRSAGCPVSAASSTRSRSRFASPSPSTRRTTRSPRKLMPVNDRYQLDEVLAECRRYVALRRRKVFVEYVMLAGLNDRVGRARSLARLLDG
jgi:23S rRNA (adenine2503-C2)-methyltransferase